MRDIEDGRNDYLKRLGILGWKVVDGIWEKTLGICAFFTLPEYTENILVFKKVTQLAVRALVAVRN